MATKPTALVTGCTPGGIGFALAKEYHYKGYRVIASARRPEVLDDCQALGLETVHLDVTDEESIKAARDRVNELTNGKLDILVNNAGKSHTVPALDATLPDIQSLFATNLFSVMMMCKEFAPLLIASKGKIVNIGSVAGIIPVAFGSIYNASKAALHSYGDTLRLELEPFGVQVITVVTGGVKSNISTNHRDILPGSLYAIMSDQFALKRKGASQRGAMDTDAYASYVVAQTIKGRPQPWVWCGTSSWIVWLTTFFPTGFFDQRLLRRWGLDVLKERRFKQQ